MLGGSVEGVPLDKVPNQRRPLKKRKLIAAPNSKEMKEAQKAIASRNKEIAATLNLSERTVKFHVSSLLSKFRVRGRMELVREASRNTIGAMPMPMPVATRETRTFAPAPPAFHTPSRSATLVPLAKRPMTA